MNSEFKDELATLRKKTETLKRVCSSYKNMKFAIFTFKLVRSFGFGFVIHSPTLNGLCVEIHFACFSLLIWGRGEKLISFENYWR